MMKTAFRKQMHIIVWNFFWILINVSEAEDVQLQLAGRIFGISC